MKLLASLTLLAFVTWGANAWLGLFENFYVGAGIWVAVALTYAVIYDRAQASKRR